MIVAISGRTASGKTTLAHALAEDLGGTAGSFGDYVRKLAVDLDCEASRANLQTIGQAAVEADPAGFLAAFLEWMSATNGQWLILDGLRHVAVRDALLVHAAACGTEARFVFVGTDDRQRAVRLRARGDDEAATAAHDSHASEADVRNRLREEADLVVTRSDCILRLVKEIKTGLSLC